MTRYVAMLRGVNVSGSNIVRMAELAAMCESLRLVNPRTYIQSGNIVFESSLGGSILEKKLESAIVNDFGISTPVIVRTQREFKKLWEQNPFLKMKGLEIDKLYLTFLKKKPARSAAITTKETKDIYHIIGREIFLYCISGYGKTVLSNSFFEKALGIPATTRNWKTIGKLLEMSNE